MSAEPVPDVKHEEQVETYFDQHAKQWSDLYEHAQSVHDVMFAERMKIAVEFLQEYLPENARILDAGCGAGRTSVALAQRGYVVECADLSQEMLQECHRNMEQANIPAERYTIRHVDMNDDVLRRQSYDGVCSLGFLMYQEDPLQSIRQLSSLVRPGGILVVSAPTKINIPEYFGLARVWRSLVTRVLKRVGKAPPRKERSNIAKIWKHKFNVIQLKRLLEAGQCNFLAYKGHGFVRFVFVENILGFRGQLMLHKFFTSLSHVLPIGRWGRNLIIVGRKHG